MKRNSIVLMLVIGICISAVSALAVYDPQTGRWLNRDPIDEPGFRVLMGNNPSTLPMPRGVGQQKEVEEVVARLQKWESMLARAGNMPIVRQRLVAVIADLKTQLASARQLPKMRSVSGASIEDSSVKREMPDSNLYRFCANNPQMYYDPLGLAIDLCCALEWGEAASTPARNFFTGAGADAAQHCYVGCILAKACNQETATAAGVLREVLQLVFPGTPESRDYMNTRIGAEYCGSTGSCRDCCQDLWDSDFLF